MRKKQERTKKKKVLVRFKGEKKSMKVNQISITIQSGRERPTTESNRSQHDFHHPQSVAK